MKKDDYTNREIDLKLHELKEILLRIEEQVMKTNGRVTALEYWKEGLMGKLIGASAVVGVIWTVAWGYINKHLL